VSASAVQQAQDTGAGDDGFVLVEALAALVVTAVVAAGLMSALHAARGYAREAAVRDLALRQARHLLVEGVNVAPEQLATRGELPAARLTWTREVAPLTDNPRVFSVKVEVIWSSGRQQGATHLETYRFAPR